MDSHSRALERAFALGEADALHSLRRELERRGFMEEIQNDVARHLEALKRRPDGRVLPDSSTFALTAVVRHAESVAQDGQWRLSIANYKRRDAWAERAWIPDLLT